MKNDILGFAWAWLALAGRKALPRLVARFRNFERPEHAPRIPAGTHTCAVVYRRPPCVPCSREREKNSRPELKVLYSAKRAHFIHLHMYGRFVQLRYFFSKGSVDYRFCSAAVVFWGHFVQLRHFCSKGPVDRLFVLLLLCFLGVVLVLVLASCMQRYRNVLR